MPELPPLLLAGLTGLVSGLLLSFPPGPINLTILNGGARRGFRWAARIGLGATVMEVIYCFIAFTSFGSFFTHGYVKPAMQLFGFVLDRKSTRLNSSHLGISYAVFCLKIKNTSRHQPVPAALLLRHEGVHHGARHP